MYFWCNFFWFAEKVSQCHDFLFMIAICTTTYSYKKLIFKDYFTFQNMFESTVNLKTIYHNQLMMKPMKAKCLLY